MSTSGGQKTRARCRTRTMLPPAPRLGMSGRNFSTSKSAEGSASRRASSSCHNCSSLSGLGPPCVHQITYGRADCNLRFLSAFTSQNVNLYYQKFLGERPGTSAIRTESMHAHAGVILANQPIYDDFKSVGRLACIPSCQATETEVPSSHRGGSMCLIASEASRRVNGLTLTTCETSGLARHSPRDSTTSGCSIQSDQQRPSMPRKFGRTSMGLTGHCSDTV